MPMIPSRIRVARERAGLSQRDLAARAGVSENTVQRAESGANQPSVQTLWQIAYALQVKLDDLFVDGSENTPDLVAPPPGNVATRPR